MTGPCGYVCDNKTSEGYCKTTACINPKVRGMLGDEIALTLNSPITDEELDLLTDVDMENTPRIVFHTKNGKEVEYLKVVRCHECKHNPKKEWFCCPMAHLDERQKPEDAWCWKGER